MGGVWGGGSAAPLQKFFEFFVCTELAHFCALLTKAYLYFLSQFYTPFQEIFFCLPSGGEV